MTDRRNFLRACIAGTGMIFVPKLVDRFRYRQLCDEYNRMPHGLIELLPPKWNPEWDVAVPGWHPPVHNGDVLIASNGVHWVRWDGRWLST